MSVTIRIERLGWLDWHWEVDFPQGLVSASALSRRGALRSARRMIRREQRRYEQAETFEVEL